MRATIELTDEQAKRLEELSRQRSVSAEALVQEAVGQYLSRHGEVSFRDHPSFGAWKGRGDVGDGVAYQRKLRAEWDREWDEPK